VSAARRASPSGFFLSLALLAFAAGTVPAAGAGRGRSDAAGVPTPDAISAPVIDAPMAIGEHRRDVVLETPHPYPGAPGPGSHLVWSDHYTFPGASYLVFEFAAFDLAPGDRVEVRDPKHGQVHGYRARDFAGREGGFITRMIAGPEAYIDLYSTTPDHDRYGYRIERISRGLGALDMAAVPIAPDAVCGADDAQDAVCYQSAFPGVYDSSRAAARILMDGVSLCTAWLVSCQNHIITANHCTWNDGNFDSQAELDRMEFQFMYQDATCGGNDPAVGHSFLGGTFLEDDRDLDYTLVRAPAGEDPASLYGWLAIDDRIPAIDETIYIPGHPGGRPKEIALYSSDPSDQDNPNGFCEVFSVSEPVCVGGYVPEIGYYCDTYGASSGSPVLSRATNRVVALHHCPNCPNRGVPMSSIWDHNQAGANPLPSCSLFAPAGSIALDRSAHGCADTIAVEVIDASLQGAGSATVSLWSDSETVPLTVLLAETPAGTGIFAGSYGTITAPPAGGDGLLSVAHGDTITARYIDADDGQGGIDIPRDAVSSADCVPPLITGVRIEAISGTSATVAWETDEPADGAVYYGTAPPAWSTREDAAVATVHAVPIGGLSECTGYLFMVQSTDVAGNSAVADNGGLHFPFTTGADVVRSYVSGDTPRPINDLTNTYSTIVVAEGAPVVDVRVGVDITHCYAGDVEIFLRGPNGIEIDLSSDNGGSGDDYDGTTFDDAAPASIRTGAAPFSGPFIPEQPLATFDGLSAAGSWILRVFDDEINDTGTLLGWSLILTFPPLACGPHASYAAHAPAGDDCALGGGGDGDGILDAGEQIALGIAVASDGTDPLTAVRATVVPLTQGVTVIDGTQQYGDLTAGVTALPLSPFLLQLPDTLGCGDPLDFRLDIVANEGSWSSPFGDTAGNVLPSGGIVLDEDFDGTGIPAAWTIVDGGATADTWYTDSAIDPLGCSGVNPGPPIEGNWAAVDSDCAGTVNMDEALLTPSLDLSAAAGVTLAFDHYFNRSDAERAEVDVRSSLTGGSWVNVASWTADTANPEHALIDITMAAAGAADVEIRWHYFDADFAWYWYVDNVVVSFTAPGGCAMTICPTGGPPGEQTGVVWSGPSTLSWNLDPAATAGYTVNRGTGPDLPALMDSAIDSCVRYGGAAPADRAVDLSADDPPPGGLYWYLVTGWNAFGQGTAGSGTAGPRIMNDGGACAP
jgi:subtilisin-like proprotein convertase family protein